MNARERAREALRAQAERVREDRHPVAPRYPNIYPLYAHDPACRCCHPNDRPYCACQCHRGEDK